MFYAMNRFNVPLENAEAFEGIWLNRESKLHQMAGFVEFNMLRGPETEGVVLYVSHTVWQDEESFKGWLGSMQFSGAHKRRPDDGKPRAPALMQGTNTFESFRSIQRLLPQEKQDA